MHSGVVEIASILWIEGGEVRGPFAIATRLIPEGNWVILPITKLACLGVEKLLVRNNTVQDVPGRRNAVGDHLH
jgi:hypothetical protein